MKKILLFSLATVFTFIVSGSGSWAQESGAEEFTLEEITVTAQKREENQQKVAIPMDVISGEELLETGKMNVDDILSTLPNVMINYAEDGMRVAIRGLAETDGVFQNVHVSNPMVALNLDGSYNASSSAGQNLFDIERVEVLHGPQSTMYGSNSPGGIVNVITAAPKTEKFEASGSVEVGNYGLFKGQAMVNAPILKDKLAMRAAFQMQKRDNYLTGATNKTAEDTKSARLKTLWQPVDNLSITVTGFGSRKIHGGMFGRSVVAFDKQSDVSDPWTARTGPSMGGVNDGKQETRSIQGEFNWDTGIGTLSVIPSYTSTNSSDQGWGSTFDFATETMTFNYQENEVYSKQKGFEARLASNPDSLISWIVGVLYNYIKSGQDLKTTTEDGEVNYSSFWYWDKNKAAYGNITYPFTSTFRGTGGIRYSSDETQSFGGRFGYSSAPAYKKPDYKLGVEYDLAANSMLFANYATSYRVNPFRTGTPPEEDKTYTVGVKNRFFDNKLQLNASAYYYDYRTVRVAKPNGTRGNITVNEKDVRDLDGNLVNLDPIYPDPPIAAWTGPGADNTAGDDEIITLTEDPYPVDGDFTTIGFDISIDWLVTRKDKMDFAATYLDAKWERYKIQTLYHWSDEYMAAHPELTDDSVYPGFHGLDFSGMTKSFSPKWTATLGYEHNFDLGTLGILVPHIDFMYKTHYLLSESVEDLPNSYQESYYTVDANATFTHASGKWSLNGYIKNATNYAAKTLLGMGSMSITDPRTYGAVLTVRF